MFEEKDDAWSPTFVGQMLDGRFIVGELLTRGVASVLFFATDMRSQATVLIKRFAPANDIDASERERMHERFVREARLLASLDHPAFVRMIAFIDDALPCIVMPVLSGQTLAARLQSKGAFSFSQAQQLAVQLFDALSLLHARGIAHRDIKPDNVWLGETDAPVLIDFGVAHSPSLSALTPVGTLMGTPKYASASMLRGDRAEGAVHDVHAAGVTIYQTLTLAHPFEAPSFAALCERVMTGQPTPIRAFRAHVPAGWDAAFEAVFSVVRPSVTASHAATSFASLAVT